MHPTRPFRHRQAMSLRWMLLAVSAVVWCPGIVQAADESTIQEARSLIPWKSIDAKKREKIEAVVNDPTIYARSPVEVFPASSELYYLLLREPEMTVQLWRETGFSKATLAKTESGLYRGDDGLGSAGDWEFLYQSDDLHIIYCDGRYRGMFVDSVLETRSIIVLRTVCFEDHQRKYVKQQLDVFVKVDAGRLKALALACKPLLQKSVETSAQQALWFVSLMCRVVQSNPKWANTAIDNFKDISEPAKNRLRRAIAATQPPAHTTAAVPSEKR